MKITQSLLMSALLLGLAQSANAAHDGVGDRCDGHKHSWQDADTDKDGAVSHDEFLASHQARAEKMFTKLDTNKDGKIDATERKAMRDKCEHRQKQ